MTGGRQPYRKGAAFENRVAAYLRDMGVLVTRNAGSKGDPLAAAFDLVMISGKPSVAPRVSLIECKLSGRLDPEPKRKLVETARAYGALAVLARPGKKRGEIEFVQL